MIKKTVLYSLCSLKYRNYEIHLEVHTCYDVSNIDILAAMKFMLVDDNLLCMDYDQNIIDTIKNSDWRRYRITDIENEKKDSFKPINCSFSEFAIAIQKNKSNALDLSECFIGWLPLPNELCSDC